MGQQETAALQTLRLSGECDYSWEQARQLVDSSFFNQLDAIGQMEIRNQYEMESGRSFDS